MFGWESNFLNILDIFDIFFEPLYAWAEKYVENVSMSRKILTKHWKN